MIASLIIPLFDYGDRWGDENNDTLMGQLQVQVQGSA